MSDDPRLEALLDRLLDSQATPDQVCASCPELLPEVRRRWQEIKRVGAELDVLFPPSTWPRDHGPTHPFEDAPLPTLPGYEIEEVLGRGGVGVVYKALHLRLNRHVAVKMLLSGQHASPVELERFLQEAKTVAGLHHPNVVDLYDVGDVDGRPYFTMELIEGGSLARKLVKGPMPAREAAALVAQVTDAIEEAHQGGVIHRDLKPGNVLLTADGTPKVTDFGLARLEGDAGLTLSGVPFGTPSYMAPEQARGERSAIGPATDVYSLGAILYECVTGRPPFHAETTTATLQQVLVEEPLRPAQLNPRIPRDAETICLKCLEKDPQRRYVSAAALADDLHRFERGDPITARPIGHIARAFRWACRRPDLAGTLASGLLLAAALVVTILWWHVQRTVLEARDVAYAEADLRESEGLRDRGEFKASDAVLRRARDRLDEYVPPDVRDRLSMAVGNLELVTRLDAIRLERALVKPRALLKSPTELLGVLTQPATQVSKNGDAPGAEMPSGRHYQEAFGEARIGVPGNDTAETAARVKASPVRGALVAALDDWAACATDRDQQTWVLAVVRQADPDSWRDRVRDTAMWDDPAALMELAEQAPVAEQSPQLLAVLGARLRALNLDAVRFLERVASAYPGDFWVNVEMGNALCDRNEPGEAIGYYRTALALRPQMVSLRYALGDLYLAHKRWDGAIAEYEQAGHLDRDNAWRHNRLGFTLGWKGGHDDEAIAHFREAIRLDANNGWSHYFLAIALENKGQLDEAVDEFRGVAQLLPEKRSEARQRLRGLLLRLGRRADVLTAWKQDLAADPPKHEDWFGYAELCLFLGDEQEYRRARRDLLARFGSATDPEVAERTGRACLMLPPSEDELRQAVALAERAVAAGRAGREFAYPYCLFAEGLARYRQGRFDDAIKLMNGEAASILGPSPRLVLAMAQYQRGQKEQARKTLAAAVASYDWDAVKATSHDEWITHILRRETEALILGGIRASLDDK